MRVDCSNFQKVTRDLVSIELKITMELARMALFTVNGLLMLKDSFCLENSVRNFSFSTTSTFLLINQIVDGWNRDSHEATKDDFGVFSLFLPDNENGQPGICSMESFAHHKTAIHHATKIKISLILANGQRVDRYCNK